MKHISQKIKKYLNTDLEKVCDNLTIALMLLFFIFLPVMSTYYQQNAKKNIDEVKGNIITEIFLLSAPPKSIDPAINVITTILETQKNLSNLIDEAKTGIIIAICSDAINDLLLIIYGTVKYKAWRDTKKKWSRTEIFLEIIILGYGIYNLYGDCTFCNKYFHNGLMKGITDIYSSLNFKELIKPPF